MVGEQLCAQGLFKIDCNIGIVFQEFYGVVMPLSNLIFFIRVPCTFFVYQFVFYRAVQQAAVGRNSLAEQDFQLNLSERRRDLILDNFDAHLVSPCFILILAEHFAFADFDTYR